MFYVFDNADGTFEGPYTDERTPKAGQTLREISQIEYEQICAGIQARAAALANYDEAIRAGAVIADVLSSPITVAIADADQQRWTSGLVALSNAERLTSEEERPGFGDLQISTLIGPVIDASGNAHDMTVTQYRQLCMAITLHIGGLRAALAASSQP